jgi:hypothetical protein
MMVLPVLRNTISIRPSIVRSYPGKTRCPDHLADFHTLNVKVDLTSGSTIKTNSPLWTSPIDVQCLDSLFIQISRQVPYTASLIII